MLKWRGIVFFNRSEMNQLIVLINYGFYQLVIN